MINAQTHNGMTNLTIEQLEKELKSFTEGREALIKSYNTIPSENLQDRIIDLGKTIGNISYELSYKKTFKNAK